MAMFSLMTALILISSSLGRSLEVSDSSCPSDVNWVGQSATGNAGLVDSSAAVGSSLDGKRNAAESAAESTQRKSSSSGTGDADRKNSFLLLPRFGDFGEIRLFSVDEVFFCGDDGSVTCGLKSDVPSAIDADSGNSSGARSTGGDGTGVGGKFKPRSVGETDPGQDCEWLLRCLELLLTFVSVTSPTTQMSGMSRLLRGLSTLDMEDFDVFLEIVIGGGFGELGVFQPGVATGEQSPPDVDPRGEILSKLKFSIPPAVGGKWLIGEARGDLGNGGRAKDFGSITVLQVLKVFKF